MTRKTIAVGAGLLAATIAGQFSSPIAPIQDAVAAPTAVQQPSRGKSSPNVQSVADGLVSSRAITKAEGRIGSIPASSSEKNVTQPAAGANAAELVVYESEECAVSRRFHYEMAGHYRTSKGGQVFPLRRADIANGPAGVRLTRPVTMTPTFVFVDHGVEIGRFTGYPGREHFLKLLNAAADEFAKIKTAE